MNERDYQAVIALPVGCVGVRCTRERILGLDYLPRQPERAPSDPLAERAVAQLRAWLSDPLFEFDLPLAPAGSAFQRRVWDAIVAIPCGTTRTYGELARELGSAARAVGQACGANPYPIVVPCHRVVAATRGFNDGLGGFANATDGYLIDIKRWLLTHERSRRAIQAPGSQQRPIRALTA